MDNPHTELLEAYAAMRRAAYLFGQVQNKYGDVFTEVEMKRMDKSTVLLQVGYKIVKRILKKRGVSTGKARREGRQS